MLIFGTFGFSWVSVGSYGFGGFPWVSMGFLRLFRFFEVSKDIWSVRECAGGCW